MPMAEFIVAGCPAVNRTVRLCKTFHQYQFAAFGYLALKIVSQLIHLLNLVNAIRVIRTDLKRDRAVWLWQIQRYLTQINILGLNCKRQQQRFKL